MVSFVTPVTWLSHMCEKIIALPRYTKRAILASADFVVLGIIVWTAFAVRYGEVVPEKALVTYALLALAPVITVSLFGWFGFYRVVTRFIGQRGSIRIALAALFAMLLWALAVFLLGQQGIPRSVVITYGLGSAIAIPALRYLAGSLLRSAGIIVPRLPLDLDRIPIVIYGAGAQGYELSRALRGTPERELVAFIDSEPSLWRQYVDGKKIYRPDQLRQVIRRFQVREVLLAAPQVGRKSRRQVLEQLEGLPVSIKVLPRVVDIASGRVTMSDAKPVDVDDLLGRDPIPPDDDLLGRSITGRSIMVSGAGGSVGSELVRQILEQKPARLVLVDISEAALFEIDSDVRDRLAARRKTQSNEEPAQPIIVSLIGSVGDENFVRRALSENDIETVYHAAAYKHVPLIEENPVSGILNNTFGCETIARVASELGVDRFVLVSTDKAVRPSSVMGASKRLAEMVLQSRSAQAGNRTVFTMVRFGNVLDSSGSVVRRFREQIARGGPVTVTHPEMIRYFMSIPEAAALVIQAGAMATGGDLYVLDMGDPVRIDDLARLMIRLSGNEVADGNDPDGEIEIVYTGLRPGEKLYEELLMSADIEGTEHPRIMRCREPTPDPVKLAAALRSLRAAAASYDVDAIERQLRDIVEGYRPTAASKPLKSPGPALDPEDWPPDSRTLH